MQSKVQRWGNSLAIRIPKAYATEMGLDNDSPIQLLYVEGRLIIEAYEPEETEEDDIEDIDELVSQITDENMHDYIDTGPAVGNEVW